MHIAQVLDRQVVATAEISPDQAFPAEPGWSEAPDTVEPGWWMVDGAWLAPDPRRAAVLSGSRVVVVSTVDASAPGRSPHIIPLEDGSLVDIGWWRVGDVWLAPDPRRAALVVDEIVTKIDLIDAANPDLPPGAVPLETGSPVIPGWHYRDGSFRPPVKGTAAIVVNDVVRNLTPVDIDYLPALDGLVLVPDGVTVAIGYGYSGGVFSPPAAPPIDLKAYAAARRYEREIGGVVVAGTSIDTSRESQSMIAGAHAYVQAMPSATVDFKAASGWVTLDAATVTAIALSVAAHVQACFAAEKAADAGIDAGTITTTAEVDAAIAA
jgi:hypothetical protein